jgi:hypothetical protein
MTKLRQQRRFLIMLAAAALLHGLLLLIPVARDASLTPDLVNTIHLRLRHTAPVFEDIAPQPEPPHSSPVPGLPPVEPVELAELPGRPLAAPLPQIATETSKPAVNSAQVLSWQFDYPVRKPLFGPAEEIVEERPLNLAGNRTSLGEVLKQPSMQLPFADSRIYLVDSYDAGFVGAVERFFDDVTVPFGFTTRHNTRVQCAWILVIAGCSWGHVSLFHEKAKRRKDVLPD